MKVALVYDRVNKWGGAERVLLILHEMFPEAPLFTSIYNSQTAPWAKVFPKIYTSFLQKVPYTNSRHEILAPLMPLAFESFNFDEYGLVVSVTSEAAKGIITKPQTKHVCYMLTPTRYLWSGYDDYFKGLPLKAMAKPVVSYLRNWDKVAVNRPDKIVAISAEVQKRIIKYYGKKSKIVYPPADVEKFQIANDSPSHEALRAGGKVQTNSKLQVKKFKQKEYYLIVSRLVKYKKVNIAVKAFNELGKKLVVVGIGKEENKLKKIANGNISFIGELTDERLADYYKNAKALIFPQIEDFGLVAVEAQSLGIPVIAYKAGGALDTVVEGKTGVFFDKQSVPSLVNAVKRFEGKKFMKSNIIKNAQKFSKERFKNEFFLLVDEFIKNKDL